MGGVSDFTFLVDKMTVASPSPRMTNGAYKGVCSGSRDLFKFWEISDNISKT